MQTAPTNNLAIASLVMSIIGIIGGFMCFVPALLAPAGAITGHFALSRIKSSGQAGRGLALAGVIVGWIGTLVLAALAVLFFVFVVASSGSSY